MTTIATLTYSQYMVLVFDKYNERYEGTYPNLKYKANVRARFEARNGGYFGIQATNTLSLGGLSATYGMYYGYGTTLTSWYEVGTINENMGCSRSKSWSWNCSCSGWPNLSGTAHNSSPTIAAPSVTGSVSNITQNSADISWSMSNNYDLYRVLIKKPDGKYTEQLGSSDGVYTLTGLTPNTGYSVQVEAWLADGSGSTVASKELNFATLENYPEISIIDIDIVVTPGEATDTANLTVRTTDDAHVVKTKWWITDTIHGESKSGLKNEVPGLPQNAAMIAGAVVTDTLGRDSLGFDKNFNTTFTYKEVWVCQNGTWKKGYSMTAQIGEFELCELWVYTDQYGWQKAPVYEY